MVEDVVKVGSSLTSEMAILFFTIILAQFAIIGLLIRQNRELGKEINENTQTLSSISKNVMLLCQAAMSGVVNREKNN